VTRFLRRYGLYVTIGSVLVAAAIAQIVHVDRQPPRLTAHATATLTIGTTSSFDGARLIAPLGRVGTAYFALVKVTWTSNGNACDLAAVMHPDGGWSVADVVGDTTFYLLGPQYAKIRAADSDALLSPTTDTPIGLDGSAGSVTILYALDGTAIGRAATVRLWLVDRCGKTKPMLVKMPRTLVDVTLPN
jgi:hypothetical protein